MKRNVAGVISEKKTTASSYNPTTIFNGLTKDFTTKGCIIEWYLDEKYTKPFTTENLSYDDFCAIKCLYGKLTIADGYAIIGRNYRLQDTRSDAYKAVFGPALEEDVGYEILINRDVKTDSTYTLPTVVGNLESFVNGEKYEGESEILNLEGGRFYLIEHVETITDAEYSIFDIDVSVMDVW